MESRFIFARMYSNVSRMATSSPSRMEACFDTGLLSLMVVSRPGSKMQLPAPQGPELGCQLPSVNAITVLGEQLSIMGEINCLERTSCSAVRDFDDPRVDL
jgi:hypothetical protein